MVTVIIEDMLRYNFYLSKWFAGKRQDKIISGTAFLFLSQISFLFVAFYLAIISVLHIRVSPKITTVICMIVLLGIMYGFPKSIQARVHEKKYDKDFNTLTTKAIYKNRLIALLLFVLPFFLCFAVLVLFYR